MTPEELAKFNGQNGQPAYVAVGGIIYDVSSSPLWADGNHEGTHQAGCDLTTELKSAPHVAAVVERFPSVGRLTEPTQSTSASGSKWPLAVTALALLAVLFFFLR